MSPGENSEALILASLPITIVTAIVSPSARARARKTEPMIPVRAQGTTTFQVDFPPSSAKAQGGFALFARDGKQDFARDGDDERDNHDGENDSGGQKAHAVVRAFEKGKKSECMFQGRTDRRAHQRHNDEDSQKAVDDTGYGCEQVNHKSDRIADAARREFGQVDGRREPQRHGDGEGNHRGDRECR